MELEMQELRLRCSMMLMKMSFGTKDLKVVKICQDRLDQALTKAMSRLLSLVLQQIEQVVEKVVLFQEVELDTEPSGSLVILSFF